MTDFRKLNLILPLALVIIIAIFHVRLTLNSSAPTAPTTNPSSGRWKVNRVGPSEIIPADRDYKLGPSGRPLTAVRGLTSFSLEGKILFSVDLPRKIVEVATQNKWKMPSTNFDNGETKIKWSDYSTGKELAITITVDSVAGVTVEISQ